MRRIVGILALVALAAVAALVVSACTSAGPGGGGAYRVRAIFPNAFALTQDTEVRVAGARVGTVERLDVGSDRKAVVILNITDPGFQDFRRDANCIIRPQSLIGERFVECRMTQPRTAGGSEPPPPLREAEFDGERQRLLPETNTSAPIDLDLVFNVNRLPQSQRLAIILNELGTGVAGRSGDIRTAVRNAAPALRDTDRVLQLLAEQNGQLRRLATDGDRSLRPLARERRRLQSFVRESGSVAEATAERRDDLETNLRLLPATLQQIRPTMRELERLSDQATPALRDLRASARPTRRALEALQPFSRASIGPVEDLGDTSDLAREALRDARPTLRRLETVGARLQPLAADLKETLQSAEQNGVLEGFAEFVYYQVMAVNGFDSAGHYLRANLLAENPLCSTYALEPNSCSANFKDQEAGGPAAPAASPSAGGAEARSATIPASARAGGSDGVPTYDERRDPKLVLVEEVGKGKSVEKVLDQFEDEPRFRKLVEEIRERLEEAAEKKKKDDGSGSGDQDDAPSGGAIRPPSDLLPGDQGRARSEGLDPAPRGAAAGDAAAQERAAREAQLDDLLGDG